jgi:hypothetical protein
MFDPTKKSNRILISGPGMTWIDNVWLKEEDDPG